MHIVTGAAGFIGMHVAERLLSRGETVIGIDSFDPYYSVALKRARAARLEAYPRFTMVSADVADHETMATLIETKQPNSVIHLAAQAGVRYSLVNPFAYERANCAGHLSMLHGSLKSKALTHFVYASSSSVYGDRPEVGEGFRETDPADAPASLYAATKRACELMSETYARLHGTPQSGLRFFTVYGPWGRPDMAYFSFTQKILAGEPIELFGEGKLARDFSYIDDIVDGVIGVLDRPPAAGEHRLLNVGGARPVSVSAMVDLLERALGRAAVRIMKPKQPGDVTVTCASIEALAALTGYAPKVRLEEGLERFVAWRQAEGARLGF